LDCQVPSAEFGVSLDSKDDLAIAIKQPQLIVLVRQSGAIRGNAQERRPDNLLRFWRTRKNIAMPSRWSETQPAMQESQPQIDNLKLEIFVSPPRIFKMGEEWTLQQVRSCNADGYLVRNYDHLKYFANDRVSGFLL